MDPLTDLFQTLHVANVVHARLDATAPWGLKQEAEASRGTAWDSTHSPRFPLQFAHFGMVSRGNCWLTIEEIPNALPLTGGDCFLLAPGISYALRDSPRTRTQSFCEIAPKNRTHVIHYGGGGSPTTIVFGFFQFDPVHVKPLARLLPPLILVKAGHEQSLTLHTSLSLLASEMGERAPGSELVVNRLADVLFIQMLRARIASRAEPCNKGWLQAVFDPQIGLALKSMHENVAAPWTVETLAAACGMSRSAFAQKFKDLVGETPLEYLTNWRMQKATAFLRDGNRKLFGVAKAVGYDSDAAFSKAFKRVFGVAPKKYAGNFKSVSSAGHDMHRDTQ